MPSAKKRIEELRELLDRANHAYHIEAQPLMSDRDFDLLLQELVELEAKHPELHDPNSPSQRIGGAPVEGFRTIRHAVPMTSIDNTYSVEDLRAWHQRVLRGLDIDDSGGLFAAKSGVAFVCDPKIDGIAVNLRYEAGELVHAVTRGDGEKGDEITAQVRAIRAIPLRLKKEGRQAVPEVLEVRGEIFMPNAEFERTNREREAAGELVFANARNSTAGTLKNLDPKVTAKRKLSFVAHGRGEVKGGAANDIESFWEFLAYVRKLGVPTNASQAM
jgi:DNA ligase (NAD+)